MADVGQLDGLEGVVLHILYCIKVVHERHVGLARRGEMERLSGRSGLVERLGPGALEVDRVGQDQTRGRIQASRWQDVLNLVSGLLRNPAVDFLPDCLRAGLEVSQLEAGLVIALTDLEEGREERM